jgi:hypothetical protein
MAEATLEQYLSRLDDSNHGACLSSSILGGVERAILSRSRSQIKSHCSDGASRPGGHVVFWGKLSTVSAEVRPSIVEAARWPTGFRQHVA